MRNIFRSLCAAACLSGLAAPAAANGLVAVVESVRGKVAGVEFMDYVSVGQVIKLGPKDSIVLGYLRSCLRETITGGTVIILDEQSLVQLGDVQRSTVKCDSKHSKIHPREAKESAGNVFRGGPATEAASSRPPLTLFGQSPMIEIGDRRGKLVIERLDKPGNRIDIVIKEEVLLRGRFLDLDKAGIALPPGGRYAASVESSTVEFEMDADARPGATPIIGRLLRFE